MVMSGRWLFHPWEPHSCPIHHAIRWSLVTRAVSRVTALGPLVLLLFLVSQCGTLFLPDEAVELALDALKATPWPVGELGVKALAHLPPFLPQIDSVVPDEVHLFFLVFGARGPTPGALLIRRRG